MFEKETVEYLARDKTETEKILSKTLLELNSEQAGVLLDALAQAHKDGIEFGYNKANEWHYVNNGDLPNVETKNYTYIRRRKRYERQFTDYQVIKCFVLCLNEKGKITAEVGYFDCNQKCFLDKAEGIVIAWKEIILPEIKSLPRACAACKSKDTCAAFLPLGRCTLGYKED